MKTNPPQIAADFIDAFGIRNTTIQILNDEEKVIWLADFEDGVPTRILATKRLFDCKENFLAQAKKLMKSSIPKKYS
jgi:hypothetical protein